MIDDSSGRPRGERDGEMPNGTPLSVEAPSVPRDADSLHRLLEARLGLSDLRQTPLVEAGRLGLPRERSMPPAVQSGRGRSAPDPQEMTPTPMVVGAISESAPTKPKPSVNVERRVTAALRVGSSPDPGVTPPVTPSAKMDRSSVTVDDSTAQAPKCRDLRSEVDGVSTVGSTQGHSSYHPPCIPPSSVVPPPDAASVSVASEYDPKAPTKPRVRRNSSGPPPPLLFGLDRMLVWGLVLGGLFVAAIVVIVLQFALTSANRSGRIATQPLDGAPPGGGIDLAPDEPHRANPRREVASELTASRASGSAEGSLVRSGSPRANQRPANALGDAGTEPTKLRGSSAEATGQRTKGGASKSSGRGSPKSKASAPGATGNSVGSKGLVPWLQ